jgi:site-specific recombinase XerD
MRPCIGTPTWREAADFFLKVYLPRHRGLSLRTVESYATALSLLTQRINTRFSGPHELTVQDTFGFLERLERDRGNRASSRNLRLAALRSFWKALALWDPAHREHYEGLLQVPFKRCRKESPDSFEVDELRAVFETIDTSSRAGFRDFTLLRYMYNTGSRISEVAEARTGWLSLTEEPEVTIRGKGGKPRVCPLWPSTAEMLRVYLRQEREEPRKGFEDTLFVSRLGKSFGRTGLWKLLKGYFGRAAARRESLRRKHLTPHSIRHSTACHLLRAGVEINVVKAWLGHADVSTTMGYVDLDLDKKREALEKFLKLDMDRVSGGITWASSPLPDHIVAWLDKL